MWKAFLPRAFFLGALAVAAPVSAAEQIGPGLFYKAYRGPDAVREGKGGKSLSAHGVDFWTRGAPAGRYRIVGTFFDRRSDELPEGDVIGSERIAQAARKFGADGLVVLWRDRQLVRAGGVIPTPFVSTTTELAAVEYLP